MPSISMQQAAPQPEMATQPAMSKSPAIQPVPARQVCSTKHANLNSRAATKVVSIKIHAIEAQKSPIIAYPCFKAVETCVCIKRGLLHVFDSKAHQSLTILRMEHQELEKLDPKAKATLIVLERAGILVDVDAGGQQISKSRVDIMAIHVKGDNRMRYFYWTKPYAWLLRVMIERGFVGGSAILHASQSKKHQQLGVWLRATFEKAYYPPHHPDFVKAEAMFDWATDIVDEDNALNRLRNYHTQHNVAARKDLSDDRYTESLHPVERELASVMGMNCAEYLLVKREYFGNFWYALYRSDKQVGGGKNRDRVRSKEVHQTTVEKMYGWPVRKARTLVNGWEVLGFIDEARYVPWIKSGGLVDSLEPEEEEEKDGHEGGD